MRGAADCVPGRMATGEDGGNVGGEPEHGEKLPCSMRPKSKWRLAPNSRLLSRGTRLISGDRIRRDGWGGQEVINLGVVLVKLGNH